MDQFQKRNKWFRMRVTEAEAQAIEELSRQAGCRTISEYCRRTLLKNPRVAGRRNESVKEFQDEMLRMKRTLKAIKVDMEQAKKFLSIPAQRPEIRSWGEINSQDVAQFQKKIDPIFQTADQIYKLWSQE